MYDLKIVERCIPYRKHGLRFTLLRVVTRLLRVFHVKAEYGYGLRVMRRHRYAEMHVWLPRHGTRPSERYLKSPLSDTLYIVASSRGWGFPHRVRWISQALSHEVAHLTLGHIGEHKAALALDSLSDTLWRDYS